MLRSQDPWNFSRRSTKAAPVQLLQQNDVRHEGNDIGMVDDTVTRRMPAQFEAAKMTKKTEQDLVMEAVAEKDPDSVVTLSATVSEQEADTQANAQASIRFAMRMWQDQTSRSKYFAHVWRRWSRVWSMPEVSRLAHVNTVQVVSEQEMSEPPPATCSKDNRHEDLKARKIKYAKIKTRRLHTWCGKNFPMRPQTKSSKRKGWLKPVEKI